MKLLGYRPALLGLAVIAVILAACGSPSEEPTPEGSGGRVAPEPTECGAAMDLSLEVGEGVGSTFVPYESGDGLRLEFASQAGLEAAISVQTTGFLPEDVESIELELLVEGAPIGQSTTSPQALRCQGEDSARLDTSIPIDVSEHPTVASVAQLDQVLAELHVAIVDADGVLIEETVEVTLEP